VEERADDALVREWDERVRAFLNDDFNTSGALGVFFEAVAACFKDKDSAALAGAVKQWLRRWDTLFFILPGDETALSGETLHGLMEILMDIRQRARTSRDFELADLIRDRLKELGIILEDTPEGTRYKKT